MARAGNAPSDPKRVQLTVLQVEAEPNMLASEAGEVGSAGPSHLLDGVVDGDRNRVSPRERRDDVAILVQHLDRQLPARVVDIYEEVIAGELDRPGGEHAIDGAGIHRIEAVTPELGEASRHNAIIRLLHCSAGKVKP